jgi:hypothetical protein
MHLPLDMPRQPTDTSCGPTCLHAIYRYFGVESDLARLVQEVPQFEEGGTLAVHLGLHAVRRGFSARIISYNLRIFDPTWWNLEPDELIAKLEARIATLTIEKAIHSHRAYVEFLRLGGEVRFLDLTPEMLERLLTQRVPIITGLSLTYLHQEPREQPDGREDDIGGSPVGHFVVVTGWRHESQEVIISDPIERDPFNPHAEYRVDVQRFINAVMLGIVSYDANLLMITPRSPRMATR